MSLNVEGQKCPVCHAYLFEEDDVVFCPECGAPHHRECYNGLGHCGLLQTHGTEFQYDRVKQTANNTEYTEKSTQTTQEPKYDTTVKCKMCGEEYEHSARNCPKCGTPNVENINGLYGFDFLGGIPADMDLGDGVTADEAKRFVLANTHRYIPKFAAATFGKKASWNWLAFLFPCGWFLSRKMTRNGILAGLLHIAFTLLLFPFMQSVSSLGVVDGGNTVQMYSEILSNINDFGVTTVILFAISVVCTVLFQVLCGIFGDWLYRNHAIAKIKEIKAESEDIDTDYRKKGGVNIFAMLLGFLAVEYIPVIIFSFL